MAYTRAQWAKIQAVMPPEDRVSYDDYITATGGTVARLKAAETDAATPTTAIVDEQTKRAAMRVDAAAQKAAAEATVKVPSTYAKGQRIDSAGNYVGYNPEMAAAMGAAAGRGDYETAERLKAEAAAKAAKEAADKAAADAEAARLKAEAEAAAAAAAAKAAKEKADADAKAKADAEARAAADRAAKAAAEAAAIMAAAQKAADDAIKAAAAQQAAAEAALAAAKTAAELAAAKASSIAANEAASVAQVDAAALAAKASDDAKAAAAAGLATQEAANAAAAKAKEEAAKAEAAKAAANLNVSGNQVIPGSDAAAAAALLAEQKAAADKLAAEQKAITDKLLSDATGKKAYDTAISTGKTPAEATTAAQTAITEFKAQQDKAAAQAAADAAAAKAAQDKAAADKAAADAKLTAEQKAKADADAKALAEKQAADKAAADAAAAAKMAMRESTIKLLTDRFNQYNLGNLATKIKDLAVDGASEDTITLALSETDEYKNRFKANQERIKKGLQVLDPGTYLRNEDSYRRVLREYGLKQFDTDDYVSKFIANDMSPAEFSNRIVTAVQRVQNADPAISKQLRDYYGIGQADLVAYVLDPEQQLQKIERQVAAAEIGVAAARQGLEAGVSVAEQLAAQGITQAEAQKGYATIADILPGADRLSQIYGKTMDTYGQSEAEQEVFNSLASAQRKRQKLTAREVAAFSGTSGTNRTSLTTSSVGQF